MLEQIIYLDLKNSNYNVSFKVFISKKKFYVIIMTKFGIIFVINYKIEILWHKIICKILHTVKAAMYFQYLILQTSKENTVTVMLYNHKKPQTNLLLD